MIGITIKDNEQSFLLINFTALTKKCLLCRKATKDLSFCKEGQYTNECKVNTETRFSDTSEFCRHHS